MAEPSNTTPPTHDQSADLPTLMAAQEALLRDPERMPTRKQRAALEALERLRMEAAAEIERLIDWLDKTMPDTDLEQSLGGRISPAHISTTKVAASTRVRTMAC